MHIDRKIGDREHCEALAYVHLHDDRVGEALVEYSVDIKDAAFSGVPLANVSPSARGRRLEALALAVDRELHGTADIRIPTGGLCVNGQRRSSWQTVHDWVRNGDRVECKSSQLQYDKLRRRWYVHFCNVKLSFEHVRARAAFDELLLVLDTPRTKSCW